MVGTAPSLAITTTATTTTRRPTSLCHSTAHRRAAWRRAAWWHVGEPLAALESTKGALPPPPLRCSRAGCASRAMPSRSLARDQPDLVDALRPTASERLCLRRDDDARREAREIGLELEEVDAQIGAESACDVRELHARGPRGRQHLDESWQRPCHLDRGHRSQPLLGLRTVHRALPVAHTRLVAATRLPLLCPVGVMYVPTGEMKSSRSKTSRSTSSSILTLAGTVALAGAGSSSVAPSAPVGVGEGAFHAT
eukprot:CAMPEP_0115880944 /NCGR_PEP_ID=MMETSP0287-20121206/28152_1 /TAXON_ID=412157 /ORGANISM="Chrysochromulina rotalis, Strain UIO044" /LENGTH=252 /DNA_ID=CAMNT_0003336811 /DNA_START=289 /DNA_END=1043 /DNA_ORIENTATION=+